MNEFDRQRLIVAFAHTMVGQIIDADGEVDAGELAFLAAHFPQPTLQELGLVGLDGRFTERYDASVDEAILELPALMSETEKVDLLKTLFRATISDGRFDPREGNVVEAAAALLGLDDAVLSLVYANEEGVADLELPEPE